MASLLDLVRKLIDYGKELAATLLPACRGQSLFQPCSTYATNDLALVLARIAPWPAARRALEERLIRARGRARPDHRARPERAACPRHSQIAAQAASFPSCCPQDPGLPPHPHADSGRSPLKCAAGRSALSSPISAETSASFPAIRYGGSIQNAINRYGGSYVRLLKDLLIRNYQLAAELVAPHDPPPASFHRRHPRVRPTLRFMLGPDPRRLAPTSSCRSSSRHRRSGCCR